MRKMLLSALVCVAMGFSEEDKVSKQRRSHASGQATDVPSAREKGAKPVPVFNCRFVEDMAIIEVIERGQVIRITLQAFEGMYFYGLTAIQCPESPTKKH